jgi:hypothetical protein
MEKRGKGKTRVNVTADDVYKFYKRRSDSPVSRAVFGKVVKAFYMAAVDDIILEGKIFYLPMNSGHIHTTKHKPKVELNENWEVVKNTVPIDMRATHALWEADPAAKEAGTLVRYDNSHSMNFVYAIRWRKYSSGFSGARAYMFIPSRRVKRGMAAKIKSGQWNL